MSSTVQKLVGFWHRYENLNLKIAFVLISLQLIHLYWLTADVVIQRITGESILAVQRGSPLFIFFIIIDYVEIPALVAGITYYALSIYNHEKGSTKNALLLSMLAIQVFHIFWITDEVVYDSLLGTSSGAVEIPYYAAWVAILVDYLELPVIADLFYRTIIKRCGKVVDYINYLLSNKRQDVATAGNCCYDNNCCYHNNYCYYHYRSLCTKCKR